MKHTPKKNNGPQGKAAVEESQAKLTPDGYLIDEEALNAPLSNRAFLIGCAYLGGMIHVGEAEAIDITNDYLKLEEIFAEQTDTPPPD